MRLILLTCLTMVAFAANSILNRLAVEGGYIDPSSFAVVRVAAGAVVLSLLLRLKGGVLPLWDRSRLVGAVSLSAYMIGFSLAYASLDAGLGALIMFGVVQVSMFAWGALRGGAPGARQVLGASVAFAGLVLVLWPSSSGAGTDVLGAALMVFAGLGWAAYTLVGRGAEDPLAATAANFVLAVPLVVLMLLGRELNISGIGLFLGVLSGAVTSGLGYSLWYSVLPRMVSSTAAVVQLSVPIIAIVGGALLLGESVSFLVLLAGALVIGGIALAVTAGKNA